MVNPHFVEVNIPSDPVFERVVRAIAAEVGEALCFTDERVDDLKLAVSEAVNNAIEHGNKNISSKPVEVVFALDNDKLEVRITDQGEGLGSNQRVDVWDRVRVVEEDNLEQGLLRSFGMSLIKALVDDLEVNSSQKGTIIVLRLYRKGLTE